MSKKICVAYYSKSKLNYNPIHYFYSFFISLLYSSSQNKSVIAFMTNIIKSYCFKPPQKLQTKIRIWLFRSPSLGFYGYFFFKIDMIVHNVWLKTKIHQPPS